MEAQSALKKLQKAVEEKDEPTLDISRLPKPGPDSPLAYYHPTKNCFVMCAKAANGENLWIDLPRERYRAHLQGAGFGKRAVESITCWCEINERIQYFGPVAGRAPGFYEDNGQRIVVDRGPRLIEPVAGEWPHIRAVIEGLFAGDTETPEIRAAQMISYYGWLQSSLRALRAGMRQAQQVLVICGPEDCGKSLLQHLQTHFLGGRSAKVHRYFSGATSFNGDFLGAEHLIIEDDYMPSDMKSRLALGAQFKQFAVGTEAVSFNPKFQQAINLRAFFRVSVTTNDEPENLMVLPPLNGDIGNKLTLLRASRFDMPMQTVTAQEKEKFWGVLMSEAPAFINFLLNEFEVPADWKDRRYGVRTWRHPELVEKVLDTAPEHSLLGLIDTHYFRNQPEAWKVGRAITIDVEDLRMELFNSGDDFVRKQSERLLMYPHTTATYMRRLAAGGSRVVMKPGSKGKVWVIVPPPFTQDD